MPRGKRTVFGVFCSESGNRIGSIRLLKQTQKGTWKDQQAKMQKYCNICMKRVPVKFKEERHSK